MDTMQKLLYEASLEGNTIVLLTLLQDDPLILDRITLNRHGDMPLHIASMLGHVDFVNEILSRAIKGHCEVVKELVQAQPHAARVMVQQDTILHLCVKHNQLEVLKFLIEVIIDYEFINSKDAHGNTILHLAVADKQVETVRFLLLTNMMIEVNSTNTNGETPLDILAQVPRDLTYQQIMLSLTRAGAVEAKPQGLVNRIPMNSRNNMGLDRLAYHHSKDGSKNYEDWLDKKRSSLMVVASLIATMAFQAGVNPPSGVWQEDSPNNDPLKMAGYAIMVSNHPTLYHIFLICNTVDFVSTLSIILLLISGLPFIKHRVFLWLLMVIMWIATTSMSLTYLVSIWVLTPTPKSKSLRWVAGGIISVWIGLMTLLVVGHTIRLIAITLRGFRNLLLPRKKTFILQST
ncbi:ankyrin repeat-containing domain, PGG domain protein [Artemisia annua]|uniref:Ankyrin repeat-containing domain, PGG domain protein n=1 Tax=Artemisia annua TaxID=35608 RepID=A0A2U1NN02_ARTAN|nr:ankyrin repeat-containing domain, PGG domain protein [Artemisia annua]